MLCSPPDALPLSFGNDSFRPHLAAARRLGLTPRVLHLPGLGLDIDRVDDLAAFLARPKPGRTYDFLRASGIAECLAAPSAAE